MTAPVLRSFWMGGFEGADHVNGAGQPLDMAAATAHLELLNGDYLRARQHGLLTVRESIGWRLSEPVPHRHDLARAVHVATTARRHGLQVVWTFMHYGTPPDVSLFDDALVERFASFAAAAARALAPLHDEPPVYNLINEIGYVAWAASHTNLIHPYVGDPQGLGEHTEASGYDVKRRLVQAVLAGIAAVRAVDPRARFLHVEPVVHVVAPHEQPELADLAERIAGYQWQVWDLIAGRLDPQLGGHADALDLVGVNHYHSGQWEAGTERRLRWHEGDPRRRPFSALLQAAWDRYRRPLIVAETSHIGVGRARWLDEVAGEVASARAAGVPVEGLCLYPLVDRHDWGDTAHWHHSGLWDVDHDTPLPRHRRLVPDYAAVLTQWQARLPGAPPLPLVPLVPPVPASLPESHSNGAVPCTT
jgi:beta-glucosidase/6-phospho-beta-glucosidase/beta-galactosidase